MGELSNLEKALGFIAPSWAMKREQFRAMQTAHAEIRAEYTGAKRRRASEGWYTPSTSANAEIAPAMVRLRDRVRDLVRNNPYAERIITVWVAHQIGDGITLEPRSGNRAEEDALRDSWRRWADDGECDADGQLDFYGLQSMASAAVVTDGEVLIRHRTRRLDDRLAVPLQLQVLEADHLDHTKNQVLDASGRRIVMGVQFDALGRREGYWLWRNHPGDNFFAFQRESVFVPADQVSHIYRKRRPGQVRGVTWLHPVVNDIRDYEDIGDALRFKTKIENCLGLVVKGSSPESPLGKTETELRNGTQRRLEEIEPGMIEYLAPGESIEVINPSSGGNHNVITTQMREGIAVGAGLTYDQLTGDFSRTNFVGLRVGKIEFRRDLSQIQWQMLIPMMIEPVWRRFTELGFAAGNWPAPKYDAEAMPPRNEPIEPNKDLQVEEEEMALGLTSFSQRMRARGRDPRRHAEEVRDDDAMLAKLGLQRVIPSAKKGAAVAASPEAPDDQPPPPPPEP